MSHSSFIIDMHHRQNWKVGRVEQDGLRQVGLVRRGHVTGRLVLGRGPAQVQRFTVGQVVRLDVLDDEWRLLVLIWIDEATVASV